MKHLGSLDPDDPFYGFLKEHILPQLCGPLDNPSFEVRGLRGSNQVFLYTEKQTGITVLGKFFYGHFERAWDIAAKYLTREWESLETFRYLGFHTAPFYVPRPLGRSYDINCVLVEEYCPGATFSDVLREGAHGRHGRLYRRLSLLASFLAKLHNSTAKPHERVNFDFDRHYGVTLVSHLCKRHLISHHEAESLYHQIEHWSHKGIMWEDNQVLVHGDATPANFLFRNHTELVAIDLEKSHYTDRLFDIGRIAGEIKHAFLLEKDDPYASEPFIGHFLWQYCSNFPDCFAAFHSVTKRLPYYIAITMLRIARNNWISSQHRKKLLDQAFLNFHYHG